MLFAEADFAAHVIAVHSKQSEDSNFDIEADAPSEYGLNGTKSGSILNMRRRIDWTACGNHFKRRVMQLINSLGNDPNQAEVLIHSGGY